MDAIKAEQAVKQYKNGIKALSGLTLSVERGEIFSLLGPNGAGKSTLIRILTTYLCPDSGRITVLERDICRKPAEIRPQIACVAQQTSIDSYLSLEENMMFQSRLYKIPKAAAKERMEQLIAGFGLSPFRKYPVSSYSGGVKRRLDIALNMMSNPKILFLDEPTAGMDLPSRNAMWDMMKKIRDDFEITIFLTTHDLEEADNLSNHICIMKDGKDVIQGTPFELRSLLRQDTIQIKFVTDAEAKTYFPLLKEYLPQKELFIRNSSIIITTLESRNDIEHAASFLLEQHIPFHGIVIAQPALEDVFLRLTQEKQEECV